MFQRVDVMGYVGKDPEVRHLPSGEQVVNFSIAAGERWKDKQTGEQKERTEWFRCTAFGRLSEVISQYVEKGSLIFVSGQMRTREYEDKEGVKRYSTDLIVRELKLLPRSNRQEDDAPREKKAAPARRAAEPEVGPDDFDDDIPF